MTCVIDVAVVICEIYHASWYLLTFTIHVTPDINDAACYIFDLVVVQRLKILYGLLRFRRSLGVQLLQRVLDIRSGHVTACGRLSVLEVLQGVKVQAWRKSSSQIGRFRNGSV